MLKKVLLAVSLICAGVLIAAPSFAQEKEDGYLLLAQNGNDCHGKTSREERYNLAHDLMATFAPRWKNSGRPGYADKMARGLREQIIGSNFGNVHYRRNVAIWKNRRNCFDDCFAYYRQHHTTQASQADANLGRCIRTCESQNAYAQCLK